MWIITAFFSEVRWKYKNHSLRPGFSEQPNISEIKKKKKKWDMREVQGAVLTDSYEIAKGTIPSHIH